LMFDFLLRVSTLTRDIDAAILSVCPSVRRSRSGRKYSTCLVAN